MKKTTKAMLGVIATVILTFGFIVLEKPVLNFRFLSFYRLLAFIGVFIGLLVVSKFDKKKGALVATTSVIMGIVVVPIIKDVVFSPIFFAKQFNTIIGDVQEGNFKNDVSPIKNLNDIRLVDEEMANKIGDKKLGESPAIGSVSKIGKFNIQKVDDKLYWVAPLVHRDFFKWINAMDTGTTGYVMVSATNPQDARLVQEVNKKPVKIIYQPDAFIHQNLYLYSYLFKGFMNTGITDWTFELDDDGNPYWVATTYTKRIGLSGNDATGVIVLNPSTGDAKSYSIDKAPKWIDRIQPESLIETQIACWGKYKKGFLNSIITEEGVLVPTPGTSMIFGEDGQVYWYTGITSSGGDESTIGFMIVNTRTKEAKLYKQPGGTETSAMKSAENKVSNFAGYRSSSPVMYNIFGVPTYVSSIKDSAGLQKKVAMVSVEDINIVGVGNNREEAYKAYKEALSSKGSKIETNSEDLETVSGVIERINTINIDGNSFVYLKIQDNPMLFKSTLKDSSIYLATKGDTIEIKYSKSESNKKEIDILEFKNNSL